jgi:hypothetical protein
MEGDGPAPSSATAFKFETRRLTQTDRIVGIATFVLFISLFLPWFGVSVGLYSGSVDGLWHGYMYLTLVLCLAIFAYLALKAGFDHSPVKYPLPEPTLLVIATGINALLTVISFLAKPGGTSWDIGAYIGLIAALVAVAPRVVPAIAARRAAGKS